MIALVPMGAAGIAFVVTANSTLQLNAKESMRGRVMALYSVVFLGSTPIGSPIVGWIGETLASVPDSSSAASPVSWPLRMRSTSCAESVSRAAEVEEIGEGEDVVPVTPDDPAPAGPRRHLPGAQASGRRPHGDTSLAISRRLGRPRRRRSHPPGSPPRAPAS